MLMNSDFVRGHAQALARRLRTETPAGPAARGPAKPDSARRIARAWQLAYQRPISDEERDWARDFVVRQGAALGKDPAGTEGDLAVWTNLCQQLLISNEFLYGD